MSTTVVHARLPSHKVCFISISQKIIGPLPLWAALGLVILFACGCSSSDRGAIKFTDSPHPNGDLANARNPASSIRGDTISDLGVAWKLPIEAEGSGVGANVATPVVVAGVAYAQDQDSNVRAIDMEDGAVIWEKSYEAPTGGPNGVAVAAGWVYGATPTAAFALDRQTGEEVWFVALSRKPESILMAPGVHNGLVYLATSPGSNKGGEVGVLWALDAKTGRKVWHFDTVPRGLWGDPTINFGGGVSYAPAFDDQGSMYVGTGNPGPAPGTKRFPWGSSRPGPNLYTQSVVKLDARTGRVQWHYQVTPHGLCDWDLGAPILLEAGGRELVVTGGRAGLVVALDRRTGKPVWKRAVGIHNGHDDDGLIAMRGDSPRLQTPMTVYPGKYGGVFGQMSANGSTVFVPVVNAATELFTQLKARDLGLGTGELVALDEETGAVRWKRDFPAPLYGATTATNDLVFGTSFDGSVFAFDAKSGRELWSDSLPAYPNGGLAVSGDTLLVPAGYAGKGQTPELLAYRLSR